MEKDLKNLEDTKSNNVSLTCVNNVYKAVMEKAKIEPNYFMVSKPLNSTKIYSRDKWMMGQQLRMSI